MNLLSLILKPPFQPMLEPHQRIELDQKENSGTSMSYATCPPTSQKLFLIASDVFIVTKRALTGNMH